MWGRGEASRIHPAAESAALTEDLTAFNMRLGSHSSHQQRNGPHGQTQQNWVRPGMVFR